MEHYKVELIAPTGGAKSPSFAGGEAAYLNPVTGKVDVVLATEQQMRHVLEGAFTAEGHLHRPHELVQDLPFVLLLGNGEVGEKQTFTVSSRDLSHRVADSQIRAALNEADRSFTKKVSGQALVTDFLVQYLDPIAFLGGYWFSYWNDKSVNNATISSASLFECQIVAKNTQPQRLGATKFSRYKVTDDVWKALPGDSKDKNVKMSAKGFGMIPANGEDSNRYALESAELSLIDLRETGFSRMRSRGVAEETITLLDAMMDYMIAWAQAQKIYYLRAKCVLENPSPIDIPSELKDKLRQAVAGYMAARDNDFGDNPHAKRVRELFESLDLSAIPTDPEAEFRPNALVLASQAISQSTDADA